MKSTALTALGGIISALSLFILFLSGILPFMSYIMPVFAGLLLIVTVKEAAYKWSFFIYAAVSALSLLMAADREAAVMYACFFGYYPILKPLLEEKFSKLSAYFLKFLIFNAAVVTGYAALLFIFGLSIEQTESLGRYTAVVLLLLGNLIFIIYDFLLTNLSFIYDKKLHGRLSELFKERR